MGTPPPLFNFLLNNDNILPIELGDLFIKDYGYLKILSDFCITNLKEQNAGFIIDGMINDVSDILNVFNITPAGLIFTLLLIWSVFMWKELMY
ncbi:MAG: hypothetical protein N3A65_07575 [candidate division WOR-3 bacterium]|nr:hypothetical protein [candidate division WOR-3 bacterium]